MKNNIKVKLLEKLKEEFFSATDMEHFSNIDFKFKIDEYATTDEDLFVDVEITWRENKPFWISLCIEDNEAENYVLLVNHGKDWAVWTSYNYTVSELFLAILFNALD